MASDFIAIDPGQVEQVIRILEGLPKEIRGPVYEAVATYLINIYQLYPPQRSISRTEAFGVMFFTEKQRRFFFAAINDGRITVPYHRTQTLRNAWKKYGEGENLIIANETPYGALMMGQGEQSRMAIKGGWEYLEKLNRDHEDGLVRTAQGAAQKELRKYGAE